MQRKQREPTKQFERFVVYLIAALACFRLALSVAVPHADFIPDEIMISLTLALVAYLWWRQSKTLDELFETNVKLEDSHVGTIAALVKTVEAKDTYTRGHSERVQRVSVATARRLGLSTEDVEVVSRAAILHDIGKLGIEDAILHKQAPLTQMELGVLRDHPQRTSEILASLGFLEKESRVASLHHERYDGKGYGFQLKGKEIPIEARIIAAADAFDAMNSDRPYRTRLAREDILSELRKSSGSQHSPEVIEALLLLLDEQPSLWGS